MPRPSAHRRRPTAPWGAVGLALLLTAAADRAGAADTLVEQGARLTADQVEAAGLEVLAAPRSLGFSREAVWVRVRAENPGAEAADAVMGWDWPLVDRLDLWWRDGAGAWVHHAGGLALPPAERQVSHAVQRHYELFRLAPHQAFDVYVRVATRGPMLLSARFVRPAEVSEVASRALLWFGVWGGALGVLMAAAIWSWRAHRDQVYVEYALFTLAMGAYQAVMTGVMPAALPGLAGWAVPLEPVLGAAAAFIGVRFARAYMAPGRALPRLDRLLVVLAWACAVATLPVAWGDVLLANQLSSLTGSLAIGVALLICVLESARGNQAARNFLVGFGPFALLGGWYVGALRGLFAPSVAAQVAFQATFLLTGLAVALALAAQRRAEEGRTRLALLSAVADRTRALQATVARLEAAQRLEAVGRLTAGVAHDFNNLLTAISAGVVDLQREAPPERSADPVLKEIRELARRGGELTRSLLMVARRQPLEPHPVALNELVAELVRLLERLMKGVSISLDLDEGTGLVMADPGQLEQVVLNLVLNARDACDGQGQVTLATRRLTRTPGQDGRPGGEWVRLSVQDDGPGMDEGTRARIFEPFFTTKAEGAGTGVGLSVVDGVARAHGGFVEVRSAPGEGATFSVWLPVAGALRQDAGPELTPPPGGALTARARSVT